MPSYERVMGTVCLVNLYDNNKQKCYDEIFERLRQIDEEFDADKKQSDIALINDFGFERPIMVCDDVYSVLETAVKISEITEGAFDPTVGSLVSLWKIKSGSPHEVSANDLKEALSVVGYKNIILDPESKSVRLKKKGIQLDLGAIAKGFATDEIVKIFKKHKVKKAVIDLGGNIYVYGKKSLSKPWNVGIKNPQLPDSVPLVKVALPEISVVTSGVYERFYDGSAKSYHHILSPSDGYPVDNDILSVSVISPSSMLADAFATAFFVLGTEKSLQVLYSARKEFRMEIDAIFIEKDRGIVFSENFPYFYSILYDEWERKSPKSPL